MGFFHFNIPMFKLDKLPKHVTIDFLSKSRATLHHLEGLSIFHVCDSDPGPQKTPSLTGTAHENSSMSRVEMPH